MDDIIALIIGIVMVGSALCLYIASRFEYLIDGETLRVRFLYFGLMPITTKTPLLEIESVRRLKSPRELMPLINGTFPSLWGDLSRARW